jgi:Rrf2 family protein
MQVALGRKGDYSVRAMLYLARHADDGRRKARVVATAMEIPHPYATQILANLVAEELLIATAGPDGGYELARPADEISLLEVVEAAEGPIRPFVEGSRVAVEFWTTMRVDGDPVTLPGCLMLDFDDEWACRRLREYRHFMPGRLEPPDG